MKRMIGAAGVAAVSGMAMGQPCASGLEFASLTELGDQAAGVALGDLDGDGDPDAVVSLRTTSRLVVARSDGAGGFALDGDHAVAGRPLEVSLADVDGDGDLDAIAACLDGFVSVLINAGDGTFADASNIESLPLASSLSVGDLDGDGDADLLVGSDATGELALMLGDGAGGFAAPQIIAHAGGSDTALADFDGDGRLDILAATRGGPGAMVLLNLGDGSFAPGIELVPGGIVTLAAGDVDGDGNPDAVLVAPQWFWIHVVPGNGDGTFEEPVRYETARRCDPATLADMDGDGAPEIVTANRSGEDIGVMFNDGSGGFGQQRLYKVGLGPVALATADVNGDGVTDVVTANGEGMAMAAVLGDGTGLLGSAQAVVVRFMPLGAAAGDADGDGDVDLIALRGDRRSVDYFERTQTGLAGYGVQVLAGGSTSAVRMRDMNGDGLADILELRGSGSLAVHPSRGDGTFAQPLVHATDARPLHVELADIDGVRGIDAVVLAEDGLASVYFGNDSGGFFARRVVSIGGDARSMVLADATGDGRIDILAYDADGQSVRMLPGVGGGRFGEAIESPVGTSGLDITAGDFDGDGTVDVALSSGPGDALVAFNDGTGRFGDGLALDVAAFPFQRGARVDAIDADGQGPMDLLLSPPGDNPVYPAEVFLFIADGMGGFGDPLLVFQGDEWADIVVEDANGDGRDDALIVDQSDNSVTILAGACGGQACRVDLDGDGELTIFDFLAFQNAFDAGDPVADFDGDGELTIFDFLAFQNEFDAGCA
ncbi:MAG: FG-GAP-like repeat-containing protein [Phycisphaerales bacterium JB060]